MKQYLILLAMINIFSKHRLAFINVIFWIWLLYIVAALVWWFISLEMQNEMMFEFRMLELSKEDPRYVEKVFLLEDARGRKSFQYIGEGVVSLGLILFGAFFLYYHTRKQFRFTQQQQNFMMAITHELKTPIAVSQLNLETLQKRKLPEEMQQKLINNTLLETSRLHSLTNNILFSAQLESGNYNTHRDAVNISNVLLEVIKDFRRRFTTRDIIHFVEENVFVHGEQLSLNLLISNLLDNAVKYSPVDSSITINLKTYTDTITLSIADEGNGISEEEKNKIFNKFYRVGHESVRTAKGTGLGLYLCKKIVKDMHGSITLQNNTPKGTVFIINFPLLKK